MYTSYPRQALKPSIGAAPSLITLSAYLLYDSFHLLEISCLSKQLTFPLSFFPFAREANVVRRLHKIHRPLPPFLRQTQREKERKGKEKKRKNVFGLACLAVIFKEIWCYSENVRENGGRMDHCLPNKRDKTREKNIHVLTYSWEQLRGEFQWARQCQ